MKSNLVWRIITLAVLTTLMLLSATLAVATDDGASPPPTPIRIGWQMPAVTQAGVVQVLKRTDVLAQHGLHASLVPFSYGTPQVEAAFAGELDAFFAGDQPAINLLAQGGRWKIVARLFYDRVALIVPPGSPIDSVEDLRGKTVASPFGSTAHREIFLAQIEAGLDPDTEVVNRNLDILEIQRLVQDGGMETWEDIDAAAAWEPNVSSFKMNGLTRHLAESRATGVVAISDEFLANNPEAAVQFLVALTRAWHFFAQDPSRVMRWYNDDTQLNYDHLALLEAVGFEPNSKVRSLREVDLELTEDNLVALVKNAAWGIEHWTDGSEIRRFVDQDLLATARSEIETHEFGDLKVILPSVREVASSDSGEFLNLDAFPLWIVFFIMVVIALLAIELGFQFGCRAWNETSHQSGRPIGTVGAAVLGMMAFVIALNFGSATNRFDARKSALLEDVTAIQTAYLRTSMLPEPHRTTVRSLLRDYVQVRAGIVHAYGQPETLRLVESRAKAIQELMWNHVEVLADGNTSSKSYESFASALNTMFNLHTKRVVLGAYHRIPSFMWWAIIFASAVAMVAVGYQFGLAGRRRFFTANLALAMTFALVIMLAFDLDRAGEGLVSVNQQPMIQLYRDMSSH